jgi:hypothetical protein
MVNSGIESSSGNDEKMTEVVKATDVAGVKQLMRGFGQRFKARKGLTRSNGESRRRHTPD